MTAIAAAIAVLVFVGFVGGSFMTCGPAREAMEPSDGSEEGGPCPMRKYVVAYAAVAAAIAAVLAVMAMR